MWNLLHQLSRAGLTVVDSKSKNKWMRRKLSVNWYLSLTYSFVFLIFKFFVKISAFQDESNVYEEVRIIWQILQGKCNLTRFFITIY